MPTRKFRVVVSVEVDEYLLDPSDRSSRAGGLIVVVGSIIDDRLKLKDQHDPLVTDVVEVKEV